MDYKVWCNFACTTTKAKGVQCTQKGKIYIQPRKNIAEERKRGFDLHEGFIDVIQLIVDIETKKQMNKGSK